MTTAPFDSAMEEVADRLADLAVVNRDESFADEASGVADAARYAAIAAREAASVVNYAIAARAVESIDPYGAARQAELAVLAVQDAITRAFLAVSITNSAGASNAAYAALVADVWDEPLAILHKMTGLLCSAPPP